MENKEQSTSIIKVSTGLERANKQIAVTNKLLQAIAMPKDFIEMVFVEGGTFMMGDDDSEHGEEKPAHKVTLSSFYIGKYSVTQAQWKAIMGNNVSSILGNSPANQAQLEAILCYNPSYFDNRDSCPVDNVMWEEAQFFINKLNEKYPNMKYRLPTEAEWEYAARGGNKSKGYMYSGSNEINAVAWYEECFFSGSTHPVGQKLPNELGIYDMSGNVLEWCHDWYDRDYYAQSPKNNPQGPMNGEVRVTRGGSCDNSPAISRVAHRNYSDPTDRQDVGFRVVVSF